MSIVALYSLAQNHEASPLRSVCSISSATRKWFRLSRFLKLSEMSVGSRRRSGIEFHRVRPATEIINMRS